MHKLLKLTSHFVVLLCLRADLRKAHEQQKLLLEEDFEKLRLSLQVLYLQKIVLYGFLIPAWQRGCMMFSFCCVSLIRIK